MHICDTTPTRDLPLDRKGRALHVIAERYPSCGDLSLARDADLKALPGVGHGTVRAIRKFVPHGRFGAMLMQACEKCSNPAEMCVCNPRVEELEALLRDARGALWELHNWVDRFEFNQDPMVKRINAALGDVLQKSEQL